MPVIQTIQLTKNFGKATALAGVDLSVKEGEVHAFLGPNGAGKSTTIRCLLGILRATSGTVQIFGQDAWKNSVELHKRLAYVPGDVNLWDNLTGGEVIDLFMSMRGKGNSDEAARREKFLQRFELDPAKKCRTYSKGNRQKVALVAAFASDVELYILDEPTSGLDPLLEKVFTDCVLEIKKAGKTVLLSSHIMSEVEKLADRVSIIKEGKVVLNGTMSEISARGKTLEELFLSEYERRA
ncbi:MAG: ABC transporter ATP-binding protein [Clostridiales bacterium]|jgi:ABC-2 type transport system ATP-binding protein|nr:ABC transporter ATP-binding protein [Clostridiales bacterium]MDR2749529.1 ABC transporter ATP-binding protein [Clostridiales bacterium]